jgi:hypothetical protein
VDGEWVGGGVADDASFADVLADGFELGLDEEDGFALPLRARGCEGCYDRGQDEGCGDEADVHGEEVDGGGALGDIAHPGLRIKTWGTRPPKCWKIGSSPFLLREDRLKSFLTKNIDRWLASFIPHFGVCASKTTALPRHTLGFVACTYDRDATNSGSGDRLTQEKGVINAHTASVQNYLWLGNLFGDVHVARSYGKCPGNDC